MIRHSSAARAARLTAFVRGSRQRLSGAPLIVVVVLVVAILLTAQAGARHSHAPSVGSSVKNASIQYYTVNNLADPGFSATASVACPSGTFLVGGYHVTPAGADLVSEGASDNAWVVTAAGSGTSPVFFSSIASCLSVPASPALQTVQGSMSGTVSGVVQLSIGPSVTEPPQPLSLNVAFTGAAGYPWSIPDTGQISYTVTVSLSTGGSLSITLSGSGVGQYLPTSGQLVEKVTLHASTLDGSLDLPLTLTTGTSSAGSLSLTGSPVDAQGNITVVGVGVAQNGTGVVGAVFNGSIIAVTFVGTVAQFPTK
jgi:hypothetical protein